MKLICAPEDFVFPTSEDYLPIVVFGNSPSDDCGSVGAAVKTQIGRDKMDIPPRAWDFLAIAMSVVAADLAGDRGASANGWTRDYDIQIAVSDPQFWNTQSAVFAEMLGFLTSDKWAVSFVGNGLLPAPPTKPIYGDEGRMTSLRRYGEWMSSAFVSLLQRTCALLGQWTGSGMGKACRWNQANRLFPANKPNHARFSNPRPLSFGPYFFRRSS